MTLTGPGGVGKTRLLLELAAQHERASRDGTVFVRLEGVTDPALMAAEIAAACAARERTEGPSADGLIEYLRDRDLLLVIDNFEHLLTAAPLIAGAARSCPGGAGAAVQPDRAADPRRADLRGRAARAPGRRQRRRAVGQPGGADVRPVRPRRQPHPARGGRTDRDDRGDLPRAGRSAAGDRAGRVALALPQPGPDRRPLTRPLAIGGPALRDLPDRQRTLQATIQWSYDLLSPAARGVLDCASVFRGGFSLPALDAVVGDPAEPHLEELLEASLARRRPEEGRFELLELVRTFAHDALAAQGRDGAAHERHRAFFVTQVAVASEAFDAGGAPGEVAAPLLADHANLRAATEDAFTAGDDRSAVALALGMRPLWLALMLRQESQELLDRLLDRFPVPGSSEVSLLRAAAFLDYGPTARAWHRRLAERAAAIGDHEALAMATGNLFGQALNHRDREEMKRLRPSLLAQISPHNSPRALGWTHYFLTLDAYVDGDYAGAVEQAADSVRYAREIGHEVMLASAVGAGLMARSARDGTLTRADVYDAVTVMRRPSVQPVAAFTLWLVARYAAAVDPEAARRWLAHAERIVAQLDTELWPERDLRDEALDVLRVGDVASLLAVTPPLDHAAALAEAAAWLEHRDPTELVLRRVAPPVQRPKDTAPLPMS